MEVKRIHQINLKWKSHLRCHKVIIKNLSLLILKRDLLIKTILTFHSKVQILRKQEQQPEDIKEKNIQDKFNLSLKKSQSRKSKIISQS